MGGARYNTRMIKKIFATLIILSSIILPTSFIFADATTGGGTLPAGSAQLVNPIKYDTFAEFAAAIIGTAAQVLMPFVVLGFIYSGFLFVKAQGNETELTKAKTAITYSIVGAIILLGSWSFAQIIGRTIETITTN